MSNSVSAATRPLLRQMENLKTSQMAQQAAWEGMEESLNKRLSIIIHNREGFIYFNREEYMIKESEKCFLEGERV